MTKTEYNRDEWFLVCQKLKPDLTPEEFEPMWEEFQEAKRLRASRPRG